MMSSEKGQHRDFLFDVGWQLMDLRQDIDFYEIAMAERYPIETVISRLKGLQDYCGDYADEQLDSEDPGWHVREGF